MVQVDVYGTYCEKVVGVSRHNFFNAGIMLLNGKIFREKKVHNDLLSQIVAIANDRFSEADFSLSALALELGYDAKYLSFLFKKKKGLSPYDLRK